MKNMNCNELTNEKDELMGDLTHRFILEMNQDSDALGILRPNLEPRATEHMPSILSMIVDAMQHTVSDPDNSPTSR